MRRAEPPRAAALAASPWPINAALRGRGVEGAVCTELGRGLADYRRRQTLEQLDQESPKSDFVTLPTALPRQDVQQWYMGEHGFKEAEPPGAISYRFG